MTTRRAQLQKDTNFGFCYIAANPDFSQREIAQQLGISSNGLNYYLKALIDKGLFKVYNFSQSKNKVC